MPTSQAPRVAEHQDPFPFSCGQVSKVPWKSILTSPPALSLLVVHCGQNFGHWMLLMEMPNFMKTELHFNIKGRPTMKTTRARRGPSLRHSSLVCLLCVAEDGLFSALPYVSLWLATFLVGWSAQKINERHVMPLAVSRKVFNSLGNQVCRELSGRGAPGGQAAQRTRLPVDGAMSS